MPDSGFLFIYELACFLLFSYLLLRQLFSSKSISPSLPPGPRKLPLVGNAFQAPSFKEWETYAKWGQKYGDIMSISVFGQNIIILNSVDIALEMLSAKGAIYSDRQPTHMIKLSGWGDVLSFCNTGRYFQQQRTLIHELLGTNSALSQFSNLIESENRRFLQRVIDAPDDLADHIRYSAGSIALRITYGYMAQEHNDPFIKLAETAIHQGTIVASPATWIVDYLPFMEKLPSWCPGTGFKTIARQCRDNVQNLLDIPYEFVRRQMVAGTAAQSFMSTAIEGSGLTLEEMHLIKWTSFAIYTGSADTTVSIIRAFFLAMALFPDVFKKAQTEIDAVVGSQRLPRTSDRGQLPYTNALLQEVFRWHPASPYSVPHKSSRDDVHAGYFIPSGSIVIPNVYFMLRDPRIYKDPERFNPERFLGRSPERDPNQMAFGFGRRACPGRLFSDQVIFNLFATSISVFNIKKKVKDGVIIEPVYRMTPGFISHPEPYEIDISPRTDKIRLLTSK